MTATLIHGSVSAAKLKHDTLLKVDAFKKQTGHVPGLAVILVGDDPASEIYVNSKCRQSEEVGIASFKYHLSKDISEDDIVSLIEALNDRDDINGILVQLPLPSHMNRLRVIASIEPSKDVDGLHPENIGRLALGDPLVAPCTPWGCLHLLKSVHTSLEGMNAVVIGASILVGKPMGLLLLEERCSVTILHDKSKNVPEIAQTADILIVATGVPELVKKDWIKPGATVIDVGINRLKSISGSGKVVGDVAFEEVSEVAGYLTPVPGGVGPMTVAVLLENTAELACLQAGI